MCSSDLPALLPAGKLKGRLPVGILRKTDQLQRAVCPPLYFFFIQSQIFGAKAHVRKHVRFKKLKRELKKLRDGE